MITFKEAEDEYYSLVKLGYGISSIAKMFDIPRLKVKSRYSENEGLLTKDYVIKQIQYLMIEGDKNERQTVPNKPIK